LRVRWFLIAVLSAVFAVGVAACGDDEDDGGGGGGGTVSGNTLTIYSSLPLQGPTRPNSESVNNGAKLALQEAGGKVGNYTIQFKTLDDATPQAGKWDPGKTQQNARQAVQDKTTIGYIGEFNSGASANSMPILNKAGILQVSPANTAIGLTSAEPKEALEAGEPDKYYPSGKRHYGRVVPKDNIQGAALATDMKEQGCKKVFIANDKEVYGLGLSKATEAAAGANQLEIVANEGYDAKAANYRSLASKIKGTGADCFFGSIIVDNNGVQLFKDVAAGNPQIKLFGPDGVAESTFTDPKEGGIPENIAGRTRITVATLAPEEYPPEGKKFFEDYEKAYGEDPEPYAIYGFEAMGVILDAIKRAGAKGNDRQAVIDAFFQTKGRASVLGTYDIDQNGDTSLTDYGAYTVKGGELTFDKKIEAQGL
jgi:branched-chain amino acid transport system substrate-binding protein